MPFDMIVLSSALIPSKGIKELAKTLGIELDNYGFLMSADAIAKPLDMTVPGIFACGYCLGPKTGDIPDSITQGSATAARVAEVLTKMEGS
jgi:heterodisulfide reductase subunit A